MDLPKLPKLERLPMRSESEVKDKEIWQPSWSCYCCEDKGLVRPSLVKLVIPSYDYDKDKLPVCTNSICTAGDRFDSESFSGCLDHRLTPDICGTLDHIARADWKETIEQRRKGLPEKKIDFSSVVKSLRKRPRSSEEEFLAQRKHLDERNK